MTVWEVGRNDLVAARRVYEERGRIGADEYLVLWRLQDNPGAFERMSAGWKVESVDDVGTGPRPHSGSARS